MLVDLQQKPFAELKCLQKKEENETKKIQKLASEIWIECHSNSVLHADHIDTHLRELLR